MSLTVRPMAVATDLLRVAELFSESNPEPITPAEILEWDAQCPEGGLRYRLVLEDEPGYIVGYGHLVHDPYMTSGLYWVHVIVAQSERGKGHGRKLFQALSSYATRNGATHFRAEVRDGCGDGLALAGRLGFVVERHLFESTLDLSTFDESRFAGAVKRAAGAGLHFFSLTDVGDTESARRRLWEINEKLGYRREPGLYRLLRDPL